MPFALEQASEFARRRGFTRALQTGEHDDGGRTARPVEAVGLPAEQFLQLIAHDADHHLVGRQAFQHVAPDGFFAHAGDEILDDFEVNVGFQQSETHLAQG